MNEDNNIKAIGDELEDSPILSHLEGKNSFSVPVGYFEDLEKDILNKVNNTVLSSSTILRFKKYLYYAAAASIVLVLGIIAFQFYSKENKQQIVESPTIENINNQSLKNNENKIIVVDEKLQNNINTTHDTIIEVDIIDPSLKVNSTNNIAINKTNIPQKQETENSPNNDYSPYNEEYANSDIINISNISSSSVIASTQNSNIPISSKTQIEARRGKTLNGNLFLPKDTCVNKPFTYNISAIKELNPRWNFQWEGSKLGDNCFISTSKSYVLHYWLGDSISLYDTMIVKLVKKPNPKIEAVAETCSYSSVLVKAGISNNYYNYYWSVSDKNNSEILLENLKPGDLQINLTVTSCIDTVSTTFVLHILNCNIEVPNVFTPNGDGFNDSFVIKGLEKYPGSSLSILDRNGKVIYQSFDYKNNWSAENISQGTYFYSLKIKDENNTEKGGIISIIK